MTFLLAARSLLLVPDTQKPEDSPKVLTVHTLELDAMILETKGKCRGCWTSAPVDKQRMCAPCAEAYKIGRGDALEEILALVLRVRGEPQRGRYPAGVDENAEGSYGAAQVIAVEIRKRIRRKKKTRS